MAKKGRHFFAKNIRYRENSLMRPKQNGDRTQSFDTNPIDNELDRRITIHSKDNESTGENQLVRGHKRFNDTIQMVDRDPFYSGYLRTQQATDNDSNVYTDSGRFPAMSLFAKNRLVTEDPEQAEGRESYSGIGVSTQTFSGLGEDVMMKKANAGLLFSSLLGSNGWETEALLTTQKYAVGVGHSTDDGITLLAKKITKSPYKVPVKSLPVGNRILLAITLENIKHDGATEHNQAIDDGTTYAARILKLMKANTIPDSALSLVPDKIPMFKDMDENGSESERMVYEWCNAKYQSKTWRVSDIVYHLDKMVYPKLDSTYTSTEDKRNCLHSYLQTLVYSVISRMDSSTDRSLSDLLPFAKQASSGLNIHESRRNFMLGYTNTYGSASSYLWRSLPWEGIFDSNGNQQLFDVIESWFADSSGKSLGKLYEIIAPLQGEMLNTYLDSLIKLHGVVGGIEAPLYDVLSLTYSSYDSETVFNKFYDTYGIEVSLDNMSYTDIFASVLQLLRSVSGFWLALLSIFLLPVLAIILLFQQMFPKKQNLQLVGLMSLFFQAVKYESGSTLEFNGITMSYNQFRFCLMSHALLWMIDSGEGSNLNMSCMRILITGIDYVDDAFDDGGLRLTGENAVVTVSSANPRSTTVNVKGLNDVSINHLDARTITCPDFLCTLSKLNQDADKRIVEVPLGGLVLANPYRCFDNTVLKFTDGGFTSESSLTVEVNEDTNNSHWVRTGHLPFRMAKYNTEKNNWSGDNWSPYIIQGGTYRLMSMLPTDVGDDTREYSDGVVLMQRISDRVRNVESTSVKVCIVKSTNIGQLTRVYPSFPLMRCVKLEDGSLVRAYNANNTLVESGAVYLAKIADDGVSSYVDGFGYLVVGEFAYSAMHIKKASGLTPIYTPNFNHEADMGCFKKDGGAWNVDTLEFGIYRPDTGKFLVLYDIKGNNYHGFWRSLERSITIEDTNDHFIMAEFDSEPVPVSNASWFKTTSNDVVINKAEPVVLYPTGNVIVMKELGGAVTVYYSGDTRSASELYFDTNIHLFLHLYFPSIVGNMQTSEISSKIIPRKVEYVTARESFILAGDQNFTVEKKVTVLPYTEKPHDFPGTSHYYYPQSIDVTNMSVRTW